MNRKKHPTSISNLLFIIILKLTSTEQKSEVFFYILFALSILSAQNIPHTLLNYCKS